MNILITGVAGFIGTNLAVALLSQAEHVVGVDNCITGQTKNIRFLQKYPHFSFIKGDIVDQNTWRQIDQKVKDCGQIFHLACPTGVPNCQTYGIEMLTTSVIGTNNVAQFARKNHARIVFTSSSEVYGDPQVFPQTEKYFGNVNPIGFRSPYEEGKRTAESLLLTYRIKYNLHVVIGRIFNTYGSPMAPDETRVIPRFVRQAHDGKPLIIYGDGRQTRTFCYVVDTVNALLLLMKKGKNGEVYNVGSDQEITIKKLAEMVVYTTKSKSPIVFQKTDIPDHKRRLPDTTKLQNLGWKQTITLEEGLHKIVA